MSKFTISLLETEEQVNDDDLILMSKKNEDGTYSSVNVPMSAIKELGSQSGSDSSNGTTDTINLFLPTTAFKQVSSKFYKATGKAILKPQELGYFVGDADPTYKDKEAGLVKKFENVTTTTWIVHAKVQGYVVNDEDEEDKGKPAGQCHKWIKSEDDTWEKSTTEYWTKADIRSEAAEKYLTLSPIADCTASSLKEASDKANLNAQDYLLNKTDFDITHESKTEERRSLDKNWSIEDIGTPLFNKYVTVRKTVENIEVDLFEISVKKTKIAEIYLIMQNLILVEYVSNTSEQQQLAYATNEIVFSEELVISEDSAVYIYGSFTSSATSNQGQSYYVEIQMQCDNGRDDTDKNWYPIYRKYMDMSNQNYRSSFNYQLYAKAGVKIRGMIAPFGNAGNIYYNLSDFCFTQCKLTGLFIDNAVQRALQIPYLNSVSQCYNIGQNGLIDFKGHFSHSGGLLNPDFDRSNNMYMLNNGKTMHTFGITTKDQLYSSYKYFVKTGDNIAFMMANKGGNNAAYPPYGPNTGVVNFTPVSYNEETVDKLATNGSEFEYLINKTTDPNIGYYSYKWFAWDWNSYLWGIWMMYRAGRQGTALTYSINDKNYPSARIGIYKLEYDSSYDAAKDPTNLTSAGLWVKWPLSSNEVNAESNNIPTYAYEIGDGATSLYYCTGNPCHECSGTYDVCIQDNIRSIAFSDNKDRAAQYSSKALTKVKKLGSKVKNLNNYAFYNCKYLNSLPSELSVETVGEYCFYGCTSLTTDMNFTDDLKTIKQYAFYNCNNMPSFKANGVTHIEKYAFYNLSSLSNIELNSTEIIDDYAFSGNNARYTTSKMTTVKLPKIRTIGKCAFLHCSSFIDVDISSVNSVGQNAFYNCPQLTSVNILSATIVSQNAFNACKALKKVNAGKLITIENRAFNSSPDCEFDFTLITDPPVLKSSNAFPSASYKNWKVYVKDQSTLEVYEASPIWKTFNTKNKKGEYTRQHIFVKPVA